MMGDTEGEDVKGNIRRNAFKRQKDIDTSYASRGREKDFPRKTSLRENSAVKGVQLLHSSRLRTISKQPLKVCHIG